MTQTSKLTHALPSLTLILYALATTVAVFAAGLWGGLAIGGALTLFFATWLIDGRAPWPRNHLTLLGFVTLGVMAFLNPLSSQPDLSWRVWVKMVTIFLPLMCLFSSQVQARSFHPALFPVLLVTAVAGILSLSLELTLGGPLLQAFKGPDASLTQYNRGLSYMTILAFPLVAGLRLGPFPLALSKRWLVIVPFVVVLLVAAGLTESRASKLALVLGIAAVVAATYAPIGTRRLIGALMALSIGWPFAAQKIFITHYDWMTRLPFSWHQRMEIWDYMSYRIMERPWLGWGLGTAHTLPYADPHGALYIFTHVSVSHPHSVVTELWVELGVPGLILGLLFGFLTLRRIAKMPIDLAPIALGAFVATLCLCLVAYDFWTDSLFGAFALTGFLFALLEKNRVHA